MKHIIVEGCDGTGKDTLIDRMTKFFGPQYELHKRASTSRGGPVPNLAEWVANDVTTMHLQPPSIYNRHPLISEPIYAKYRIPPGHHEQVWYDRSWVSDMRQQAKKHCLLVVCQPPFATVKKTVMAQGQAAHMPGVYENLFPIYVDYIAKHGWPGGFLTFDYTRDDTDTFFGHLIEVINYLKRNKS